MSSWTHINGIIRVEPLGRTQAEKRYILDTVLSHLPKVTGSEEDMYIDVIQEHGYNTLRSHDEFGQYSNLYNGRYHSFEMQDYYKLVVHGNFRDRVFDETYKEFIKWLCRLSKRVMVEDILVEIKGWGKCKILKYDWDSPFYNMFEDTSWMKDSDGEPNWCEYLMWNNVKNCQYPAILGYKYYADTENDRRVEEWIKR